MIYEEMVEPFKSVGGCQKTLAVVDPGNELATTATGGNGFPMIRKEGVDADGRLSPTAFVAVM
jgi:hypothetical protein